MKKSHRKVFRAHLDDVENLSYGKGAKKQRGTGSRFTCHRLNRDERRIYDLSKRDGYLITKGSGYRKERKGSPLWNIHRQRCDAMEVLCLAIEKRPDQNTVIIDFSTLRILEDVHIVRFVLESALRANHPQILEALVSKTNTSRDPTSVRNSTLHPIQWETVKTRPIWDVDERVIGIFCDPEVAKSIALGVLEATRSDNFHHLLQEADRAAVLHDREVSSNATLLQDTSESHFNNEANVNIGNPIQPVVQAPIENRVSDGPFMKIHQDVDEIDWDDI